VEQLRRERADRRVQPPCTLEEEPSIVCDSVTAHQMLECGYVHARRMDALDRLIELLRVADEHERLGRRRNGECVRERELTGLIDHEDVDGADHVLAPPEPRGAGNQLHPTIRYYALQLIVVVDATDFGELTPLLLV